MKPDNKLDISERNSDAADSPSVEEFFRQLEAREKDLDIAPDLVIEVEESEFDDRRSPDLVLTERPDGALPPTGAALDRDAARTAREQRAEIALLEESVRRFKDERASIIERLERERQDFENFRRRVERDRLESFSTQMTNLAIQILPVLDNLERAIKTASALPHDKLNDIADLVDGIVMINQQVNEVLAEMGVDPIRAVGTEFDPELHEAVAAEARDGCEPNTVIEEMLRGYRMGSRIIRHSLVKVASSSTPLPTVNS
ncbi:MAG: nucleotide exchange factor GrpE [Pyrinomonadaceae bacterium]